MERVLISEVANHLGNSVKIAGWVHNVRILKGLIFVIIRDISGQIQVVVEESNQEVFSVVNGLNLESILSVEGTVQEKPSKSGNKEYELLAIKAEVLSLAAEQMPIPVMQKIDNEADVESRFNWRWLDLRKPEHQMIFKVWTELEKGFRQALSDNHFIQLYTPTFMSTASETGSEVFAVKYFDREVYLAQSPQFYKQMAMASGLERVFAVGPVYRAEKSFTNRHCTEFTGWDFEMSYIDSENDVMEMEEKMLVAGFEHVNKALNLDLQVPTMPFPRISMKEAKEKLAKAGIKSEQDDDFGSEEEQAFGRLMKEETGHDFVFVTDYPITARPFYHMRKEENQNITKSFDLLYKGIEITTGSQREHRPDVLAKQAEDKGMNLSELEDYLNFFRYGCPPHGGAGIGPGRIIMKIMDLPNIREAVFLPRDVKRVRP